VVRVSAHVVRADGVERWAGDGPFAHLDIRSLVGAADGAQQLMFGQTTYPPGSTHERHLHPRAEEVVYILAGRAEQEVGGETLALGPGDACFVPRGVPHRVTAVSDEDMVMLWVLGGASSLEAAGYEAVPE
jgi:quercetin dioxygenase-like cupin family protein